MAESFESFSSYICLEIADFDVHFCCFVSIWLEIEVELFNPIEWDDVSKIVWS